MKTAVDTGSGRSPVRIDLFVKPMRNEHHLEGPLIWIGESNFPIGFRVGANSLPELIELAGVHGRQLLPGEEIDLHIFLVPDKVPPEPVVEVHVDQSHPGPDDLG